ncbi:MAG: hypothetical protein HOC94_04725, partial [Waddliaceae bacterium]|nr:hypothetical protein [Waddliaceae bacterium]
MRTKTIILTSLISFLFCMNGYAMDAESTQTGSTKSNFFSKLLSRGDDLPEKDVAIEDDYNAKFV